MKTCPKCDQEMQRQPYEPDVGIMMGGWYCTECDVFVEDEDDDYDDLHEDYYDVADAAEMENDNDV